MKSHEVLKLVVSEKGAKQVAPEVQVSRSLLYKWCQSHEDPDASGAANPLDRLLRLMEFTDDDRPLEWLCKARGGFYVPNPTSGQSEGGAVLEATQKLLADFSDLLSEVSSSYSNDAQIDTEEARRIREEWEDLKSFAECFVTECESGLYRVDEVERSV